MKYMCMYTSSYINGLPWSLSYKSNYLCDKVCLTYEDRSVVFPTYKTDHQDITEILLKLALNTIHSLLISNNRTIINNYTSNFYCLFFQYIIFTNHCKKKGQKKTFLILERSIQRNSSILWSLLIHFMNANTGYKHEIENLLQYVIEKGCQLAIDFCRYAECIKTLHNISV